MNAVIWSKYDCTYCDQAKALMTQMNMEFEERKIGDGWSKEDLLESVPTARSVPQIFINGNHIGGFDELRRYLEETAGGFGDGRL